MKYRHLTSPSTWYSALSLLRFPLEGLPLRFRHNQATEDEIRIALNGIARRCGTALVKKQNLHSKSFYTDSRETGILPRNRLGENDIASRLFSRAGIILGFIKRSELRSES